TLCPVELGAVERVAQRPGDRGRPVARCIHDRRAPEYAWYALGVAHLEAKAAVDAGAAAQLATLRQEGAGGATGRLEGPRQRERLHDAGRGREQRGERRDVRLQLARLRLRYPADPGDIVRACLLFERIELRDLLRVHCNDELAGASMGDAVRRTPR